MQQIAAADITQSGRVNLRLFCDCGTDAEFGVLENNSKLWINDPECIHLNGIYKGNYLPLWLLGKCLCQQTMKPFLVLNWVSPAWYNQ